MSDVRESSRLYQTVEDYIFGLVRSGDLKPSQPLGSAADMARKLNVSTSTVQHTLQTLASKGVVIRRARQGTFIHPDINRSMNMPKATKTISLIVPDIVQTEFVLLLRAFQDVGCEKGIDISCASTDHRIDIYIDTIHRQITGGAHGIVMVPPFLERLPFKVLSEIEESKIPVISCFRSAGYSGWPIIAGDDVYGSYQQTLHLINMGCKNIAYFSVLMPDASGAQHFEMEVHHGYLKALFERGAVQRDLHCHVPFACKSIDVDDVARFLRLHPDIDGVACCNDFYAAVVIRELEKMGNRIPQDVCVVGAGNISQYLGFELGYITSLVGIGDKIASKACELIDNIRGGDLAAKDSRHTLRCELRQGKTTRNRIQ